MRFVPGDPQAARDGLAAHHLHSFNHPVEVPWSASIAGPEFAQGANGSGGVRMIDALVPAARSLRKIRIVAYGIERGLQDTMLPGFGVLRHEENVAAALVADLVDELGEAGGAGKIYVGVRLQTVTGATRDEQHVARFGHLLGFAVLFPAAQAVQFQRVDELAVGGHEVVDSLAMLLLANDVEVPHGVVEYDEDVGQCVKRG